MVDKSVRSWLARRVLGAANVALDVASLLGHLSFALAPWSTECGCFRCTGARGQK